MGATGSACRMRAAVECVELPWVIIEKCDSTRAPDSQAMVNQRLLQAAREGHLGHICRCLEQGANIETRRPFIVTLEDEHVKERTPEGLTPLMLAAEEGYAAAVELLLKNRASVNAEEEDGMTPLHFAAVSGCPETCCALLIGGADVNAKDHDGCVPLYHVPPQAMSTGGDRAMWKTLLGHQPQAKLKDGDTAPPGLQEVLRRLPPQRVPEPSAGPPEEVPERAPQAAAEAPPQAPSQARRDAPPELKSSAQEERLPREPGENEAMLGQETP